MRADREELLKCLESMLPGLSTREIIEQSSCFIFEGKKIITYNDEIACSQNNPLSIKGAVQALPLIAILRKLKETRIEILESEKGEELLIKGKKRRAGIRMEKEIILPIDSLEAPKKKWKDLPEDFADAISLVHQCAGKDETQFVTTCINIHPNWIEATDNYQAARYKIETNLKKSVLIRRDSLKHIISLNMTKFNQSKNWIHFKNQEGLILSCRRFVREVDDYPNISSILKTKGDPIALPKGLKDAIEKAEIFSAENAEENQVIVNLRKGKLKITGRGASGWFCEIKKIKYRGQSLSFAIAPNLLIELVQRHTQCQITERLLKADIGKFRYVTALDEVE
jgi:DNA polymerase III sliding clamp (beta) subunit (PCNA family)